MEMTSSDPAVSPATHPRRYHKQSGEGRGGGERERGVDSAIDHMTPENTTNRQTAGHRWHVEKNAGMTVPRGCSCLTLAALSPAITGLDWPRRVWVGVDALCVWSRLPNQAYSFRRDAHSVGRSFVVSDLNRLYNFPSSPLLSAESPASKKQGRQSPSL